MAVSLARRYTLSPQGSGNSMDAARSANVVCFGSFKLDLKAGELHQAAARSFCRSNLSKS